MQTDNGTLPDRLEMESGNYNDAATLSPVQSDSVVSEGSEAAGFYSRVWYWFSITYLLSASATV